MSNQTIVSELFVSLSNHQQEVVAGGADFELSGSNYANRLANLQGITASQLVVVVAILLVRLLRSILRHKIYWDWVYQLFRLLVH